MKAIRTLWGLIDRTDSSVRDATSLGRGIMLGIALAPVAGALIFALMGHPSLLYAISPLLGISAWTLFRASKADALLAEQVFGGLHLTDVDDLGSEDLDEALTGAMLATGVGARPKLYEVQGDGANACVDVGPDGVRAVALTPRMRQILHRDEIEAVFAQLLVRGRMADRFAVTMGPADLEIRADAEATRLLGYPEHLCSALEKSMAYSCAVMRDEQVSARVRYFINPWYPHPGVTRPRLQKLQAATHLTSASS